MNKRVVFDSQKGEISHVQDSDEFMNLPLDSIKEDKRIMIENSYESEILLGYRSPILISSSGRAHTYSIDKEDHVNLLAKYTKLLNETTIQYQPWKTKDYGIVLHTREEFLNVVNGIMEHVENLLFKSILKKMEIEDATTFEQLESVMW